MESQCKRMIKYNIMYIYFNDILKINEYFSELNVI
jgi:hypothetical protein